MAQNFKIESIGQIHIGVRDINRAIAFYRDVLGLPLLMEFPEQSMAFFDCGGVRLYLSADQSDEFPSNPLIYYTVSDVEAVAEALRGHGVELKREPHVVHRTETSELWMTGFHDPEGNRLSIYGTVPRSEWQAE